MKSFCLLLSQLALQLYTAAAPNHVQLENSSGSARHSAPAAPPRFIVGESWNLPDHRPLPFGRLAALNGTTVFSREVNRLRVYAGDSDETWLGTDEGIKRIDHARKTVRHYTQLDGLPGSAITAIVAHRGNVWCAVSLKWIKRDMTALCRYDRKADRWAVVREIGHRTWSFAAAERPKDVEVPSGAVCIAESDRRVAAVPTHLPSLTPTHFYIFDSAGALVEEVPWEPSTRTADRIIVTTFAAIAGEDVWLGTNHGLLQYNLAEKRWRRHLPGRIVQSGVLAEKVLWLATSDTAEDRALPQDEAVLDPIKWRLTRFDTAKAQHADHRAPEVGSTRDMNGPWIPGPGGMNMDTAGKLWIAPRYTGMVIIDGPRWERPTLLLRFDPEVNEWKEWLTPEQHAHVPPPALRFATLPFNLSDYMQTRLVKLYAVRHPAWYCAEGEVPESVSRGAGERYLHSNDDGTITWKNAAGAEVRIHAPDGMNPRETSFTMSSESTTHLWALIQVRRELSEGTTHVGRFERASGKWKVWSNEDVWPLVGLNRRVVADGERAWAISTRSTSLFDPQTNRWIDVTIPLAREPWARPEIVDVQPDGRYVWLLIPSLQHPLPAPLPAELQKNPEFLTMPGPLVRWDTANGTYRTFDPGGKRSLYGGRALLVEETSVWLATGNGFYRLNKQRGEFETVTPPLFPTDPNRLPRHFQRLNGTLWLGTHDLAWRLDDDRR